MGVGTHRRRHMKHTRKAIFFSLPNEVFLLGLSPGEPAVYSYLP